MRDIRSRVDAFLYIRRSRSDRDLGYNVPPIVAILVTPLRYLRVCMMYFVNNSKIFS